MLSELEEDEDDSSLSRFFDIHLFMTAMRRVSLRQINSTQFAKRDDAILGVKAIFLQSKRIYFNPFINLRFCHTF